jgi:hypothetical protein
MRKLVADITVARNILHGRGGDVWEMVKQNFPLAEASSSPVNARGGTSNRSPAQPECGQASLPWAERDCSTRGSYRQCP